MAALAIGVSDAPPLPYLGAAVAGAHAFHEWAQDLGYESRLVTDDPVPVTAARLRRELEELLSADKATTRRLLIYFAGHGLIREAEEGLWLLSDWYRDLRGVAVESLKRRLSRYYRVEQIGFFADACRNLPRSMDTADLTPDGLLGSGPGGGLPGTRPNMAPVDKFIAAQDGAQTFMIPGSTPEEDRCLFSGVLMEALWGTQPAAFSKYPPGKVTSRSLGAYLEAEVPRRARVYGLTVNPSVSPTFPEDYDIYFGDGPPVKPPVLAPWPSADQFMARRAQGPARQYRGSPPAPARADGQVTERLREWEQPTECGFAVNGAAVYQVWTSRDITVGQGHRPDSWLIRGGAGFLPGRGEATGALPWPAPVLVEFVSGSFASVTALPDFFASVAATDRGAAGIVYRKTHAPPGLARAAEDAIGLLERGALRADDATSLAVELREGKHVDPVLGVISAYLYDSVGDVDSIRRMAFYYIRHDQPIPYDIALLAQLGGQRRGDGLLQAAVPAVPPREPRTERESRAGWTHSATPAAAGVVGGLWPWLRQGWAFLDDPAADGSTLVLPGLAELAGELMPARFTTLKPEAGRELAAAFGLAGSRGRRAPWERSR